MKEAVDATNPTTITAPNTMRLPPFASAGSTPMTTPNDDEHTGRGDRKHARRVGDGLWSPLLAGICHPFPIGVLELVTP